MIKVYPDRKIVSSFTMELPKGTTVLVDDRYSEDTIAEVIEGRATMTITMIEDSK